MVERHAADREECIASVDRLWHAVTNPECGPATSLRVTILDVVVDEREVVSELYCRSARECAIPVWRD